MSRKITKPEILERLRGRLNFVGHSLYSKSNWNTPTATRQYEEIQRLKKKNQRTGSQVMTNHDQNAIDALWPIMAATCVDETLTWSGHARAILDAIRAGKIPGVAMWRDLPCYAELKKVEAERDAARREFADMEIRLAATERRANKARAERDAAESKALAVHEVLTKERDARKADNARLREIIAAISIHDPLLPASLWKKVQAVVDERNAAMHIDQELSQ